LHVSLVLRPRGPPARLSGLTLVVAVAVVDEQMKCSARAK